MVAPPHRPRVPEVVVAPPHRPRVPEVVVAPRHRPWAIEASPTPRLPSTLQARSHAIEYLAGDPQRSGLTTQLNRLARVHLADVRPCGLEIMQRELTPDTARYHYGSYTPAPGSTAPFVSPKSAVIAARMLWGQVCEIAKRWYGGRTSPLPEDDWPHLRARTRARARQKAIDNALEDWTAQSDSFAERVREAVLEIEIERWQTFFQDRDNHRRKKSASAIRQHSTMPAQHRSPAKSRKGRKDGGPER